MKKKKKKLKFYEDILGLEGNSFECDTIKFIFKCLLSISDDKHFSFFYDFTQNKEKKNQIFEQNNLFSVDEIQMDFLFTNLKISDLIQLLIDIFPLILSNSKISFNLKNNNNLTLNDLHTLKNIKKESNEKIDIIGEIGINIFNEEEKCHQLIKYKKLIHNINKMIKGSEQLIVYWFIEKKNLLFRTKLLQNIFKQFKNKEKSQFNQILENEFETIIKQLFKSNVYENLMIKLNKIEKK